MLELVKVALATYEGLSVLWGQHRRLVVVSHCVLGEATHVVVPLVLGRNAVSTTSRTAQALLELLVCHPRVLLLVEVVVREPDRRRHSSVLVGSI